MSKWLKRDMNNFTDIVEAYKFTGYPDNYLMIEKWSNGKAKTRGKILPIVYREIIINETGNLTKARVGDYIIKDSEGKVYSLKSDIFEYTYVKSEGSFV